MQAQASSRTVQSAFERKQNAVRRGAWRWSDVCVSGYHPGDAVPYLWLLFPCLHGVSAPGDECFSVLDAGVVRYNASRK
jgi:hypothetical protein